MFAWRLFSLPAESDECYENDKNPTEIVMDLIILNYMRSLRTVAVVTFVFLCGPFLLCSYCLYKPKPPVSAKKLNELFSKVTMKQITLLREKNYKHQMGTDLESECNSTCDETQSIKTSE